MPELSDRAKWERMLQREFRTWGKKRVEMLQMLMGNPPDPSNVPASFWRVAGKDLRDRFEPILREVFLAGAHAMGDEPIVPVNWKLANERAARWASRYAFNLVKRIEQTAQTRLQDIFDGFFKEKGTTVGDLRKLIEPEVKDLEVRMKDGTTRVMTSAERAKLIATTEVTRASVEGEREVIKQIEAAGIEMVAIWETQRDDKVCLICKPRQGKEQGDGWSDPPPAHPGCYCTLRYVPRSMLKAKA